MNNDISKSKMYLLVILSYMLSTLVDRNNSSGHWSKHNNRIVNLSDFFYQAGVTQD